VFLRVFIKSYRVELFKKMIGSLYIVCILVEPSIRKDPATAPVVITNDSLSINEPPKIWIEKLVIKRL